MFISEKISMNMQQLAQYGPITIAAIGDSVTHGALDNGEIDYDTLYLNLLRKKINGVRNYVPVNVINAAIGGTCAKDAVKRMDKQVLAHNPDLIIICFGLNDINLPLDDYINGLKELFAKAVKSEAQVIFMTPNMLNTYVAEDTLESLCDYAKVTAQYQTSGKMDSYISSAVALANEMGVTVCDCYSKWKELSKTQDTTMLLANRINHPTREMHELFAQSLFEILFENTQKEASKESLLFKA